MHRELAGGKGFADMVYIPRKKYPEKPALVVELKWDKSAAGAISQIKEKEYCQSLEEYQGNLLLVGINYYTVVEGEVYYRENSVMTQVELSDTAKGRANGSLRPI